jgi:hypothetical protein
MDICEPRVSPDDAPLSAADDIFSRIISVESRGHDDDRRRKFASQHLSALTQEN